MKLELCNIVKSFGNTRVLDDLSVTVPEGGTLIITGASGVGKTTLVSIILGILKPDSGSVTPGSYRCSPVFQEDRLIENLYLNCRKSSLPMRQTSRYRSFLAE